MLFGEYLISKCKITEGELLFALKFQRNENVMAAINGVAKGYLTYEDVSKIMDYLRETGLRFDEAVINMGLLNMEQIKEISNGKENIHHRIGEILVMCGVISKLEMEAEHLNFKRKKHSER
ncbi:MAG: hypothetical protein HY097_04125 [Nitrospinae bacterium]|nr:hypothetical protein [Nitrospinota bacterium]